MQIFVGKLAYRTTGVTDCEGNEGGVVAIWVGAGDKRIQAFDTMHQPALHEFFQCPVNLQRRAQTIIAQTIQNAIGAKWRFGIRQSAKNEFLVFC